MFKIGAVTPGTANLPIPSEESDLARLKELLSCPGGLNTAQVLPAHQDFPHFPGLFPDNPYADDSPATMGGDNLFDSDGKNPPQPASVPVPFAHHDEVPPLSEECRRWAQAFHNRPVDEAEVARVRALLNGTQPPSSCAAEPVDDEVARVRALLDGKPWG